MYVYLFMLNEFICVYAYCIHAYIFAYIYACILTYIHANHTYMHISIRAYIHAHPRILHSISRSQVITFRGRAARTAGAGEASGGASRGLGVLRRPRAVIFLSRDASKFSSPLSQRTVTGTPAPDHPGAN